MQTLDFIERQGFEPLIAGFDSKVRACAPSEIAGFIAETPLLEQKIVHEIQDAGLLGMHKAYQASVLCIFSGKTKNPAMQKGHPSGVPFGFSDSGRKSGLLLLPYLKKSITKRAVPIRSAARYQMKPFPSYRSPPYGAGCKGKFFFALCLPRFKGLRYEGTASKRINADTSHSNENKSGTVKNLHFHIESKTNPICNLRAAG